MSELSPETRAFIDAAARGDAPTLEDRARVRHKLVMELGAAAMTAAVLSTAAQGTASAAGQATAAVGAGVSSGKAAAGISVIGKWLAAISLVGVVSTGAVVVAVQQQEQPERRVAQAVKPLAPVEVAAVAKPQPAEQAQVALAEPPPVAQQEQAEAPQGRLAEATTRTDKRKPRGEPPVAAQPTTLPSIAEETALLRQAQLALKAGKPEEALAHAQEHARRFAKGALAEEREAVTMLARCAKGPLEAAELSSYLTGAPESPIKARVKKACVSQP